MTHFNIHTCFRCTTVLTFIHHLIFIRFHQKTSDFIKKAMRFFSQNHPPRPFPPRKISNSLPTKRDLTPNRKKKPLPRNQPTNLPQKISTHTHTNNSPYPFLPSPILVSFHIGAQFSTEPNHDLWGGSPVQPTTTLPSHCLTRLSAASSFRGLPAGHAALVRI